MRLLIASVLFLSAGISLRGQIVSAQSPDSVSVDSAIVSVNDSTFDIISINLSAATIGIPDSMWQFPVFSSAYMGPLVNSVPTCASLQKRDELFYWGNDSIPYCGECVVMYGENAVGSVLYQVPYIQLDEILNYTVITGQKIMILSHYTNGKRDGTRSYYDGKGHLIKTEIYDNGALKETIYTQK